MRTSVPALWSFNGGYVDTAGFLALHGLFTSHVTGNFVTLGATISGGPPACREAARPARVLLGDPGHPDARPPVSLPGAAGPRISHRPEDSSPGLRSSIRHR